MADRIELTALRSMLDVLEEMRADQSGPTIPWSILQGINRLVPSAEIGFVVMDHHRRQFTSAQALIGTERILEGAADVPDEPWWKLAAASRTPANPRFGETGVVYRWTDRYSRREIHSWALYQEYWVGVGDNLLIEFPAPPGQNRRLLLWRDAPDRFTVRDQAVLELLRPHLFEIDRRAQQYRSDGVKLTAREWQVLELVADGASNAEIARMLVTSVGTVRKHMEHIFDHSGVRSRGAAVAKLMPLRP